MARKFNHERAAMALADAVMMGDQEAANRHNTTVRSIQVWRARLDYDPMLVEFFAKFRNAKRDSWADEIPEALSVAIQFLKEAAQQGDRKNPDSVKAITEAAKTLADIGMTQLVINKRLEDREDNAA